MDKELTVAELIAILQKLPQDMAVEMSMGLEYQCPVTADMIEVLKFEGQEPYLCITDTPGY